jgi:hypothetical protein
MSIAARLHRARVAAALPCVVAAPVLAQAPVSDAPPAPTTAPATRAATSLVAGGFLIGDSRLALLKGEHARGRWALVADVTRDAVAERWTPSATQVASRGEYVMWGASAALRRYTRDAGRGFFAEVGGGAARATLDVTPDGGARVTRRATVPLATWGVGGRAGLGRMPAFVEGGLRSAIPLATRHLHAGDSPPVGSTRELVTYQSWYFGRGKPSSQMYLGIGLRR